MVEEYETDKNFKYKTKYIVLVVNRLRHIQA